MVKIKEQIVQQSAFQFMTDELQFSSPMGRKKLLHRRFLTDPFELQMELEIQKAVVDFIETHHDTPVLAHLTEQLCQVNDISQTFVNLVDGNTLDDIQLFEVKKFSLICWKVAKLLNDNGFDWIPFHDLSVVIDTLDPERTDCHNFIFIRPINRNWQKYGKK